MGIRMGMIECRVVSGDDATDYYYYLLTGLLLVPHDLLRITYR